MKLLAVTSLEEMDCLASLKAETYWTSGSNEDFKCDLEKKYAWCSTGYNLSATLLSSPKFWLSTTAAPSTLERCLALVNSNNAAQKGMVHRNCKDALPYICQYPVDCPQQCIKNMTWLSNYLQCCALGMEALNIDNIAEQLALTTFSRGFNTTTWKANFNYWTSGTWKGSPVGLWSWCEPSGPVIFDQGLTWERGQPDNRNGNESCVHFRFIMNSTGTVLTDRNCSNSLIYACKQKFFDATNTLMNFFSYGDWYDGCGRNFLTFTSNSTNWTTAWDWCCSIGLTLASMESAGKISCYSTIVSKFAPTTFGDFWISGTNVDCPSTFRWCSRNLDFIDSELKWKAGHPKDGLNCVFLEVRNGSVLLASADCAENKTFLCDVRKNQTSQKAMQAECAGIWNITSAQIDLLMNVTAFLTASISINIKVLIKKI
ncbi:uncharacterized protein LOC135943002 [Cloeon dipterum]|uniref:uncharacterized protein LOC135943002 n=1 Tax=Cloeon dipterum TaxID=197152 RepID=UPI00321FF1F7